MKLYALFENMPKHDRVLTGHYAYLNLENGAVLFVCFPPNYALAEKHLEDLGGKVFPDLHGGEQIPSSIHEHPALSATAIAPTDTTYSATKKLAKHFGWITLDPR